MPYGATQASSHFLADEAQNISCAKVIQNYLTADLGSEGKNQETTVVEDTKLLCKVILAQDQYTSKRGLIQH